MYANAHESNHITIGRWVVGKYMHQIWSNHVRKPANRYAIVYHYPNGVNSATALHAYPKGVNSATALHAAPHSFGVLPAPASATVAVSLLLFSVASFPKMKH
jgi:hypothetical protein